MREYILGILQVGMLSLVSGLSLEAKSAVSSAELVGVGSLASIRYEGLSFESNPGASLRYGRGKCEAQMNVLEGIKGLARRQAITLSATMSVLECRHLFGFTRQQKVVALFGKWQSDKSRTVVAPVPSVFPFVWPLKSNAFERNVCLWCRSPIEQLAASLLLPGDCCEGDGFEKEIAADALNVFAIIGVSKTSHAINEILRSHKFLNREKLTVAIAEATGLCLQQADVEVRRKKELADGKYRGYLDPIYRPRILEEWRRRLSTFELSIKKRSMLPDGGEMALDLLRCVDDRGIRTRANDVARQLRMSDGSKIEGSQMVCPYCVSR